MAEELTKKLKPLDVDLVKRGKNPFAKIVKLRDICRFTDIPLPSTAYDVAAGQFILYLKTVQPILAAVLFEQDSANGALNRASTHRHASRVADQLDKSELKRLHTLRLALTEHLYLNYYALAEPPPLSGGDTAQWSVAVQSWVVISLLTCVLLRFDFDRDDYERAEPSQSRYLCANNLVLDVVPVARYSLRLFQQTVHNLLNRLCAIKVFDHELDTFVTVLQRRAAELICGGGTEADGYNAEEWSAPIAFAHTGIRQTMSSDGSVLACTTEFLSHSLIWFVTLNNHIANYYQLAPPPSDGVTYDGVEHRVSFAQAKSLRWFPNKNKAYALVDFLCEYAATCTDDTYMHGLRNFVSQFEASPDHAAIYRMQQQSVLAIPAEVLNAKMPNMSPVGKEYVRLIKYGIPLLEWLHRFWNWRYGETRIRSAYMSTNSFYTQLAVLHIINLFFANRTRIWFKQRFVLFHRDPAFIYSCNKAKRTGYPFIVQTFSYWSVFVPHRQNPTLSTFPADTSQQARADANVGNTNDDDDSGIESSEVFYTAPKPASSDEFNKEREAQRLADERGDDVALSRPQAMPKKLDADLLPIDEYCRVYDCETIIDAFLVWAIALLHIRKGVIDKVDISSFICRLLGWPPLRNDDDDDD